MAIEINGKKIGEGHPCFITYEAGPTHSGKDSAIELVKIAAEAGADAVKFQILDPERLVADKEQLFTFDILVNKETGEQKTVQAPLYDLLKSRSMSQDEWKDVKKAADEAGIAFFATVGFEDEVAFLEELGCDSVKIASADLNHFPLLRLVAKTDMLVQLDTGNGTLGEVERAVEVLEEAGCKKILIHQCPSGYPAHTESIHLKMIKTLKQMFGYPIAFSDHTPGEHMDIAALALGANLIEKTITKDRCTPSVEHIFSLEPEDAVHFVDRIREVETAMGEPRKAMSAEQKTARNKVRRSAFLKEAAAKGSKVQELHIEYRRPGDGIAPDVFETLEVLRLRADMAVGSKLSLQDFE
jgi:N,N'-diacetyllegionaminate synthase